MTTRWTFSPSTGLGGIIGTLLIPLLALEILDGHGYLVAGRPIVAQFGVQALGVLASMAWAALFHVSDFEGVGPGVGRGTRRPGG